MAEPVIGLAAERALSTRRRPRRAGYLRWVLQDMAGLARQPEQDHRSHLRATLEWLCRAQDVCRSAPDHGAVSAGWTFESGWLAANGESSGALIETLLPAAEYLGWPDLAHRARAIHDSLLAQPDEPSCGRIHGLIAGHRQLQHPDSLPRALRAGYALCDIPVISARQHAQTAHALAALGTLAQDEVLMGAARRHLDAALAQQTPCGWFADSGGPVSIAPVSTAFLADVVRGLIEAAGLLDDARALRAAIGTAASLRAHLHDDGRLDGAYDDGWTPAARHVCVAGLTRLAACWLRLSRLEQQDAWRDAAWRALAWIKRNQRTVGEDLALRDALPEVAPIWRGPAAFRFETISAKYFADALMMDMVGITIPPVARKVETA